MMLFHTRFIVSTLAGHRVEWNAQSRNSSGISWRQAWAIHRGQTITGILATILIAWLIPDALLWFSPILIGLVFAVPISVLVSDAALGESLKQSGWLQIPEEVELPEIVERYRHALGKIHDLNCPRRDRLFHKLLDDPIWLRNHLSMIEATDGTSTAPATSIAKCEALIRGDDWTGLPNPLKQEMLTDPSALTEMHQIVWSMRSLNYAS